MAVMLTAAATRRFLLVLLLQLVLTMVVVSSGSARQPVQESVDILLDVKAAMVDRTGALRSWAEERSSSVCQDWEGVACENSSIVVAIDLANKNLSDITECESLKSLDLSNNNFTGKLPTGMSRLLHVETMSLGTNSLVGSIPEDLGLCSRLTYLDLGGNYLEGEIPQSIANLSNLVHLTLAGNELTGQIPRSLGQLNKLEWIYLGYNHLSGSIPPELGSISTLKHLDLVQNNLTGEFPPSLTNLTNLEYLFLYDNELTGAIPSSIVNLSRLFSLDLSSNKMSGVIPSGMSELRNLLILNLFSNEFSGYIPEDVADMRSLQVLALWMNRLTGHIPARLGAMNNLTLLDLSSNRLTGRIPEGLCASGTLHNLILFSNSLSGSLPHSLAECRSLKRIRMEDNLLSGSIPVGMATLPHVYYMDLSNNNLSGRIDRFSWNMPALQVLRLHRNNICGTIPSLQNSKDLETLDLSQNKLAGTITLHSGSCNKLNKLYLNGNMLQGTLYGGGFLKCRMLSDINLSSNNFSGHIPGELVRLMSLSTLDLSHNCFSGPIPPQLGNMDSLVSIDLSFNNFSGEVPRSGVFIDINATLIEGNPGLCWAGRGLRNCPSLAPKYQRMDGTVRAGITATLFLVGLMIAVIGIGNLIWKSKHACRDKKMIDEGTVAARCPKSFHAKPWSSEWSLSMLYGAINPGIDEILEAMQEENAVEKGRASYLLYKGSTQNGLQFAAMELIDCSLDGEPPLRNVLAALAKLEFPNLVPCYGVCTGLASSILLLGSIDGGCSLSRLLRNGFNTKGERFHMERRLQVAIDIAKTIIYMQSSCSPAILHGSISCDTVIVDSEFVARLLPPCTSMARLIDTAEYSENRKLGLEVCNEKDDEGADAFADDVRAFGELLAELFCGTDGLSDASTACNRPPLACDPRAPGHEAADQLRGTVSKGRREADTSVEELRKRRLGASEDMGESVAAVDGGDNWSEVGVRKACERLGRQLWRERRPAQPALEQALRSLQELAEGRRCQRSREGDSGSSGGGARASMSDGEHAVLRLSEIIVK
ncbi:hypothetical protein KP509_17G020300 [Ceratopteris richardii]|uniref:Protein kinase domain-containing protein n=1 Tax=Ceratopteris richardii TaxID=49495 RepID=A0A8T2SW53_CERRI|nr:hypothetical protein KP509_17G020300 [Ceratopteris richardii]